VNSTFRQVGIATGIAALGSIFSQRVADAVRPELVAGHVPAQALDGLTAALSGGQVVPAARAAQQAAAAQRGPGAGQQAFDLVHRVGSAGVVDSLNHITMIATVMAFTAGILCLGLIRQKDFVDRSAPTQPQSDPETAPLG
jgi:preprotein translocase subunit SecG